MVASEAAGPFVKALQERARAIRTAEMDKARRRLGRLRPEQEQALDALATAIVDKLLMAPTAALSEMASEGRVDENAPLVRAVLGLA
jgi:glutamyl-tRNA reductase